MNTTFASEVLATFPVAGGVPIPATYIRSTILGASVLSLRTRGHFDRYIALLPAAHHKAILESVAGTWIPMEIGLAHYRACNALELTAAEQFEMGASVSDRVYGSFLGTLVRIAKGVGFRPTGVAKHYPRLWERVFQGGGFRIARVGPKDLEIDFKQVELFDIPYFRRAFRGLNQAGFQMFASHVHVREASTRHGELALRLSWV